MSNAIDPANERKLTNVFERYLTVWVALSIIGGTISLKCHSMRHKKPFLVLRFYFVESICCRVDMITSIF